MDFRRLAISFLIVGIFVFSLFAFIITTQNQNNPENLITNNTIINSTYSDLSGDLLGSQSSTESAYSNYNQNAPQISYGELSVFGIFSSVRNIGNIITGIPKIIIQLPMIILGVPPIVAGVIDAIIFILLIIGAWAVVKGVIA